MPDTQKQFQKQKQYEYEQHKGLSALRRLFATKMVLCGAKLEMEDFEHLDMLMEVTFQRGKVTGAREIRLAEIAAQQPPITDPARMD